ncbi:MAG: phenylalanine--tRNA ligase subunit beta [Candidatus Eisenbacteria bacterium]|uniref:phenylalanine--tRNA ligase n=1 Tax=Eiseniibacteriota bacterium TaxID=2212470 RepID=A0A956NCH8_UNCEI|nr:phenylalanine--tRNA ligase subunit beta [Candidatus Eisenbacteria bacterium]MCB9462699.1 phenylalanine--tRNA ligase subunit beta [Candidatus Eisenbacteria bacterium]
MPVIGIPTAELRRRIGEEVEGDKLLEVLGDMGCDVEGLATLRRMQCVRCGFVMELAGKEDTPPTCGNCTTPLRDVEGSTREMSPIEVVRMELLAVRPDMFDPAGLARAIRGVLGIETGPIEYPSHDVVAKLTVDPSVRRPESLRPHIACAVIENVTLDDDSIKLLMKLQENLHWALGRNRKHASIGVYDLDSLGGDTEFEYTTEPPDYRFVPLGATGSEPWTLERILEEHAKGRAYANLLQGFDRYPILRSKSGQVLSMPPIINSEETKVHGKSRRFFIDVTGSGQRIVQRTLAILVTSILEYHKDAKLGLVEIHGATDAGEVDGATTTLVTPDLAPQIARVDSEHTAKLLGIPLSTDDVEELLRKMRHGISKRNGTEIEVEVPAYRNDILHERDLMEDAAIAFGYRNIPRALVPTLTVGKELHSTRVTSDLRDILVGMGYLELFTIALTSTEQGDDVLGLAAHPRAVVLDNPISSDQTQLRTSLLPGLLQTFARNRHNALPQRVFELGEVSFLSDEAETGAHERHYVAFGTIAPKVGFAEIRAEAEAFVREARIPFRLERAEVPFLVPGRAAFLVGDAGAPIGVFGEVHPRTLARLGLQNPAVMFEMTVPTEDGTPEYLALGESPLRT